ncbi:MAG: serine/threonine protein kinase [Alphaproteobacteria bacterium]|nr:serine/threonine protein kinase [Alphaproteobacteria bacterium]
MRASLRGYVIEHRLGAGSGGEVYAARAPDGRPVALKRTSADIDPRRIQREIAALRAFDHPGIVVMHDAFEDDGHLVLVMERVFGMDLGVLLGEGPFGEDTWTFGREVAEALAHAHAAGHVHRDIKPANLMLGHRRGMGFRAVVVDFGLAKAEGQDVPITRTAAKLGTPRYMAPEQFASARTAGPHSDMFGLGAVLYRCLTGGDAFPGTIFEALDAIAHGRFRRLEDASPKGRLVEALLSVDPADRPTAAEVARELVAHESYSDALRDRVSRRGST